MVSHGAAEHRRGCRQLTFMFPVRCSRLIQMPFPRNKTWDKGAWRKSTIGTRRSNRFPVIAIRNAEERRRKQMADRIARFRRDGDDFRDAIEIGSRLDR